MKKFNQFPLVGFFFLINSQKWEQKFQPIPNVGKFNSINSQSQMGTKFSTNSQWGEIKFNQFPVLLECQRKRLIPLGISWRTKSQIWEQIFQSIPTSGNAQIPYKKPCGRSLMKTKVVQHVQRINISISHITCENLKAKCDK